MHGDTVPILKRSGRGETFYYPDENALLSVFHMQCSVTLFSFGRSNVGQPGSNKAAYRCETPKQAWPEMSGHPSSITHGEQKVAKGTNSPCWGFFCQGHNSSSLALGWCVVTAIHLVQQEMILGFCFCKWWLFSLSLLSMNPLFHRSYLVRCYCLYL